MTPQREQRIKNVLSKRQPDFTLIFENVWDPHNISAVLRSADAVGILEVYVIYTQTRTLTKLGRTSSASAKKWIEPNYFYSVEECFEAVRKKYDKIYCTHLSSSSQSLYELDLTQSVALVFGNEREGVSDEVVKLSDGNFIIPMMGMVQSLNISVACAVSIYEGMRQRQVKGLYDKKRLEDGEYSRLFEEWRKKSDGY